MQEGTQWRYYDVAVALFVAALVTANIIAVKLIQIGPLMLPAGVVIFPISYILGDVLTEVYGYRYTRRAIWLGFMGNLVAVLSIYIAGWLPAAPFWQGQAAYQTILSGTPRLLLASFVAYLVGEFANSTVLVKMKIWTQGRYLWLRTIGSTVIGQGLDSLLFIIVAFAGLLTPAETLTAILSQWLFKTVYEVLATPITYWVIHRLKRIEKADADDTDTHLTPFAF